MTREPEERLRLLLSFEKLNIMDKDHHSPWVHMEWVCRTHCSISPLSITTSRRLHSTYGFRFISSRTAVTSSPVPDPPTARGNKTNIEYPPLDRHQHV